MAWDGHGKKEHYWNSSHSSPWLTFLYKAIQYFCYLAFLPSLQCCKSHCYNREHYFYAACLILSEFAKNKTRWWEGKAVLQTHHISCAFLCSVLSAQFWAEQCWGKCDHKFACGIINAFFHDCYSLAIIFANQYCVVFGCKDQTKF